MTKTTKHTPGEAGFDPMKAAESIKRSAMSNAAVAEVLMLEHNRLSKAANELHAHLVYERANAPDKPTEET